MVITPLLKARTHIMWVTVTVTPLAVIIIKFIIIRVRLNYINRLNLNHRRLINNGASMMRMVARVLCSDEAARQQECRHRNNNLFQT
tara:strand:+ start:126 stop:386 length:261 start_codon:yes stop_codon:yes gene_type:complete